jgi:D-lactate dehydrogenase
MRPVIAFFDIRPGDKPHFEHALEDSGADIRFFHEPLQEVDLSELKDVNIISTHVSSRIDHETIRSLPALKHIACRSTGFDHVDLETAKSRGISVSYIPNYGQNTVAEYAFTLMLALTRKLIPTLEAARDGQIDPVALTGRDLGGKTLGVVGAGRIGYHVIKIANGFEMKVIAYDPYPNEKMQAELGYKYVELKELLEHSDIITLHAPATKENQHLIDFDTLKLMKKSALLVNTARGDLIDTKALIAALTENKIGGAALDVVEGEALLDFESELHLLNPHTSKKDYQSAVDLEILEKLPNAILTCHNAYNSQEALTRIRQCTFENIQAYLSGHPQSLVPEN